MPKLSDLKDFQGQQQAGAGATFADLPDQIGGSFPDPPQPGPYRFQLPQPAAIAECWETMDTERGQRIVAVLRDNAALLIVQSPAGRYNGEPVSTRISNAERRRGKDETKLASDMDYVLAVTKFAGKKPSTNLEYAQALLAQAGKQFGADWEFQWFCNANKPIRVEDPGNGIQVLDGQEGRPLQQGCGERYYQKQVNKEPNEQGNMEYPVRIVCNCGAQLRAFGQIARFRE